jgi:hypothetical protein
MPDDEIDAVIQILSRALGAICGLIAAYDDA